MTSNPHQPRESAATLAHKVLTRETSAIDLTRAALARATALNPALHAFLSVLPEQALAAAASVDARIAQATTSESRAALAHELPLAGVPVAIKDNLCTGPDIGGATTCASKFLEHYHSPFTATCVQKLQAAGAIIIAKTNLDEFAMGSSTEHSAFGPTRNPHDHARTPGGSSGGSAACVAAGICTIALGSDTGGSVRQPAAHCGIVGIKPTYGRVSRYGLVAYASSLDQVGVCAQSVDDAALVLSAISGHDPHDATSARRDQPHDLAHDDLISRLHDPLQGLCVGVVNQAQHAGNHPAVADAFDRAARVFAALGAEVVPIDLPMTDAAIAAYYIIAPAEASSNLARFDGVRYGRRAALREGEGLMELYCKSRGEGFGAEVKRRILLGTHVLSSGYHDAYYTTALRARRRVRDDFQRAFEGLDTGRACDVVLLPTTPAPPKKLGEATTDPAQAYLGDMYTVLANLAGLPAISVPAGWAHVEGSRLPVGVQLVAPAFHEARLLRAARMLEQALAGA